MKWLVVATAVAAAYLLGTWLRQHPRRALTAWSVLGVLPFVQPGFPALKVGLAARPLFPGYTHGLEVTLLDVLALSLFLSLPPARRPAPLFFLRVSFLIVVAASVAQAAHPGAAVFVVWQFVRMYFLFGVVARASSDPRVPAAVLRGLTVGVLVTCALGLAQRYLLGYHEVHATFGHQNGVGLASNFGVMPAFALLLGGRANRLSTGAPAAGAVAVILSLSRGSLLMLIVGTSVVFLASLRHFSWRKLGVGLVAFLVGGLLLAKALDQLEARFTGRSYGTFGGGAVLDERARLELASAIMLREHPLGVGPNHHTWALHAGGYLQRAGILARGEATDNIKVHNLYWLVATEMGYPGIVGYLTMVLGILGVTLRGAWVARESRRGDVLLGLGVAMLLFHVHGLLEWIQLSMTMQYVFWLSAGIAVGLTRSPASRHSRPVGRPANTRPSGERRGP
jgi:hypothetical protein